MSEGELFALVFHGFIALILWTRWYRPVFAVRVFGRQSIGTLAGVVTPLIGLFLTVVALQTLAASDVVGTVYVFWYAVMTAAWVGAAAVVLMPIFGMRWRDDVVERRNPAAAIMVCGAVLGLTLTFLGGNFGDGPGWWVVAFCGILGFVGFFGSWLLIASFCPMVERITIERDLGAALRLAGVFLGGGAILGRALAGDWVSMHATWVDFIQVAWPVPLLALIEVSILRMAPIVRTLGPGVILAGLLPAGFYVMLSAMYLTEVGWW